MESRSRLPPGDSGLQDSPYGLAAVDAIVLHPPDLGTAPAGRTVLFPERMQQITGLWTGNRWPIVVAAYRQGEPVDAVPLDQVMLRENETRFVLWIPYGMEFTIRIFDSWGLLSASVDAGSDPIRVGLTGSL